MEINTAGAKKLCPDYATIARANLLQGSQLPEAVQWKN